MYGLVNRAIKNLVVTRFGQDTWKEIATRAELSSDAFVAMETYDDKITYNLVGAASAVLELPPADILEAFGHYWATVTIEDGYGDLLPMIGSTLEEFMDNLDTMHARIAEGMPDLVTPRFDRVPQDDGSSILVYDSDREGLAPMVVGLIKGLGERFDEELEVEPLGEDPNGAHRFHIRRAA